MTFQDASVKDVQNKIYDVMLYVHKLCKNNNIKYFLSGGTLLGAVRHKGFIPWDDDADIMFLREDYERFLQAASKDNDARFKIGSIRNDVNWTRPWARVWDSKTIVEFDSISDSAIGVYVDILPIDGLPDGMMAFKLFNYRIKWLNTLRNAAMRTSFVEGEKHRFIKKIIGLFAKRHSAYHYASKVDRLCASYKNNKSNFCGVSVLSHYMEKERFSEKCFEKTVEMDFEGSRFMCPSGYDAYLRQLYGDYMVLPPLEKQKSEHIFRITSMQEDYEE